MAVEPWRERVEIGDAVLLAPFVPHMTRLAEPDKVFARVSFCNRGELPKWNFMMHRKRLAYVLATQFATPALFFNNTCSYLIPPLTAIRRRATNPLRRVIARSVLFHKCRMAFARTKAIAANALVLSHDPRFHSKGILAPSACKFNAFNRMDASDLLGGECIRRAKTSSPLVSNLVFIRHHARPHMPSTAASKAAKPSCPGPVGLYEKVGGADFTRLRDHGSRLAERRHIGKRTTDIACRRIEDAQRQGRLFDPPKPKAVQPSMLELP